jgi:glycosyltransferase involved in cell wall biosynthesis
LNPAKRAYLRSFFKSNDINIVLGEYGPVGCAALGICRELRLPLVIHFHGYDAYSRRVLEKYHEAYQQMFRYCSAVVAVSSHMLEQLARIGAPREKMVHNPYGVDTAEFRPTHLRACPLQVVAVGRMVEKKAPYLTILAFRKVLQKLPEARLVMVGDGILRDICRKMIKSLGMDHAVELKGALGHRDVAELMRQSRIFVQHSVTPEHGDSEGTPVGIIEAGASGLPVVSTRHGGIVDIVLHGKTGFLVDEGDIDGMADYMCRLLLEPELAEDMGRQAREHVSRNYELSSSIQNLRAVLDYHAR